MSDRTPTAARPTSRKDSHWYAVDGSPMYELIGKTTGKPKAVTLRDARQLNLLPGVTGILKILHKEALVNWMIEQACLAILTTPRQKDEAEDAFVHRVLHVEEVQNQESAIARDKGTEIHGALEDHFLGVQVEPTLWEWVRPAAEALETYGALVASEKILVGEGYAGKTDLILEAPDCFWIWDYKSTKKLPDPKKGGAWSEHRLQLSAYARAYQDLLLRGGKGDKPIRTANLYISSLEPAQFVICEHEEWETTFNEGFAPLVTHWQWMNSYRPKQALSSPRPVAAPAPAIIPTASEPPVETVEAPAPAPAAAPVGIPIKGGKHVVWTPGIPAGNRQ